MSDDDWANQVAKKIVGEGEGILLPLGVERGAVSVKFPNRMALVRRIAGALRDARDAADVLDGKNK